MIFSFACIVIFSCTKPNTNIGYQKLYFDLAGFFDEQVAQLYKDSLVAIKTSEINGVSDQHQMPWTDWKKEFSLFYGSEINKASYAGKYSIDTIHNAQNDSSLKEVQYKAKDINLRTQLLEVIFYKHTGKVKNIHIINHASNFLSGSDEELFYEVSQGYIIKTKTSMKLFGEDNFAVKGEMVEKNNNFIQSVN
ncbi:MAG: hypothetical protein H0W62_00560 [Chitinophagales bacterium]|nr:hypothetical protein [Chitinophagales bacterium]